MPPARRQLPPPDPAVRQRALTALLLGALSLIGLMLGLGNLHRGIYVAVLTLVFAVVAIWFGVTASRQARRSGTARPRGAAGGVVLGGLGLAFSALWLLVLAVFWPQLNAYYTCLGGANTVAAQQACHSQFNNSVGGEISVLRSGRLRLVGILLDHADRYLVVLPVVLVLGGPRVQVDPVAPGVVGLVDQYWPGGATPRNPPIMGGFHPPIPPWLGPPAGGSPAEDEPVRGGRG